MSQVFYRSYEEVKAKRRKNILKSWNYAVRLPFVKFFSLSAVRSFNNNKQFTILIIGLKNTQKQDKCFFWANKTPEMHKNYQDGRNLIPSNAKISWKLKIKRETKQKTQMRGPNKIVLDEINEL